jgi:predicted permease
MASAVASIKGIVPPFPIEKAIDMLANASAPVAPFAVGGSLAGLGSITIGKS